MQTWKVILMVAATLALFWTAAHAEFYRYIDADGKMRFTDDLAAVPPDQRPDIKTYQSVKSQPVQVAPDDKAERNRAAGTGSLPGGTAPQEGNWNERVASLASELDRMQVELNKSYRSLQAERDALSAQEPLAGATKDARDAYRRKVKALNAKIEDYEARYAEFKEKQKAFNDQYNK